MDRWNKKGDVAITVLVLLVLVVTGAALLTFLNSSQDIEAKILESDVVDIVNTREASSRLYLKQIGEEAYVMTYLNFVEDGRYLKDRTKKSLEGNSYLQIGELSGSNELNEEFIRIFRKNLVNRFRVHNFEDNPEILKNLFNKINLDEFEVSGSSEKLEVKISDFSVEREFKEENLKVTYSNPFSVELSFAKERLIGFEEILEFKQSCVGDSRIGCYDGKDLDNFNVEASEILGEVLIKMTSKNEYLIEKEFKKIEFSFIAL